MPEGVGYGPQDTASVGLNLNIIGENAYAFSGTFATSTSTQTVLEFTTGGHYIIGEFFLSGGVIYIAANLGDGQNTAYKISINGIVVSIVKLASITEAMPTVEREPILLSPYSSVKVEILSSAASGSSLSTCSFVGKVYGKIE